MSIITPTIYASALQSAQLLGIPYNILPNTTLNEKFSIDPDIPTPEGAYPVAKYIAIGRGGHRHAIGADGSALVDLNTHRASDPACFAHIPWVLREVSDDIDPETRKKYALRRIEQHDNIDYVAYYLRRLDHDDVGTELARVTVQDGNTTSVPFVPSASDLSPVPVVIDPNEITETSGEYITATTRFTVGLTEWDVEEIVKACTVIYGQPNYATLSEVALCSGIDVIATAQNGEDPVFQYAEARAVQVMNHICTHYSLNELNQGLELSYEVGGSESLTIPSVDAGGLS